MLKDSIVTPRKIINEWDNIWWPASIQNKIPAEEAEKIALEASFLLHDYCRYDFTDWTYTTLGTDITARTPIPGAELVADIDIVKINLESNSKHIVSMNIHNPFFSLTMGVK